MIFCFVARQSGEHTGLGEKGHQKGKLLEKGSSDNWRNLAGDFPACAPLRCLWAWMHPLEQVEKTKPISVEVPDSRVRGKEGKLNSVYELHAADYSYGTLPEP